MKTCPKCGEEYGDGVDVCPSDKTPLPNPETQIAHPPPVDPAHVPDDPDAIRAATETEIRSSRQPQMTGRGSSENRSEEEIAHPISGVMEPGTVWGSYRLLQLLGKGGMGEVYLAEHRKLGRKVALKLLRARYLTDRDAVKRFFREARIVNQIRHPNIVEITDFIENEAGSSYFIMELLEGQTLGKRRAGQGALPVEETLEVSLQICDALTAIHDAGIVHRDLKPDNVFLTMSMMGGPDVIKLLDFGLVKLPEMSRGESHLDTNPETLLGTPEYMSPEQIRGLPSVDHRSDIYSLGTIMYECVAGVRPITAPTFGELLVNVVTENPSPPSQIEGGETPELPAGLEELIMRCLEKDPDDRPQTAAEIHRALVTISQGDGVALNLPALKKRDKTSRKGVLFGAVAAALAGLVALVLVLVYGLGTKPTKIEPPKKGPLKTIVHKATRPGRPIARLSEMWRKVDHLPQEDPRWKTARREMLLHHLDALRTGVGARAQVIFKKGSRLDVDERSELLIEAPLPVAGQPAPRLARLRKGTMRVVALPGTPIRLVTPDGKIAEVAARGDAPVSFRVTQDDEGLELAVLKGAAAVKAGGKHLDLESNQLIDVKGDKVSGPVKLLGFPQLVAPGVDAKIRQGRKVVVRWKRVDEAKRYRVQVSHFVGFDEKYINQVTNGTSTTLVDLKPETYIWRVRSIDAAGHEGEFGFARRFAILQGTGPVDPGIKNLLRPVPSAVIEYAKRAEPVTFSWRRAAALHEVVVARSPNLRRFTVVKRSVPGTSVSLDPLQPGVYYWGVYSVKRGRKKALFRRPRRFVIVQRKPPKIQIPALKWK
jgi:serine/threonine protein kinase